jgi:hypothetical protein
MMVWINGTPLSEEEAMDKVLECPECDVVVGPDDEEKIVLIAQVHAKEKHDMELTREQILSMARPA